MYIYRFLLFTTTAMVTIKDFVNDNGRVHDIHNVRDNDTDNNNGGDNDYFDNENDNDSPHQQRKQQRQRRQQKPLTKTTKL